MDPNGPIAKRFPLIARFRPVCLPPPERVRSLTDLAATARQKRDQGLASAVFNQAALLASDVGLSDLAREMCHRHAAAYLNACPLPVMSAIRGLEPLVNLARLHIRAHRPDTGRHRLQDLYEAVTASQPITVDGITVPADLTATADDRHEVRAWLWRVLLADGTRTLTTTGRWPEALVHIEKHRGVGNRMLDGRQVAVLATLIAGAPDRTLALLAETTPGDPWENAVTACLTVLCHRSQGRPTDQDVAAMLNHYEQVERAPGHAVFHTRLALTIIDAADGTTHPAAHHTVTTLIHHATTSPDGYVARELLAHPTCERAMTAPQARALWETVAACALGHQKLPPSLLTDLTAALDTSEAVLHHTLATRTSDLKSEGEPDPG